MFLNNLWFVLIAILWIGYLTLEGFDFGVGMLLRILGRDEKERRAMMQLWADYLDKLKAGAEVITMRGNAA